MPLADEPFSYHALPKVVRALLVVHAVAYLSQWLMFDKVMDLFALSPARVVQDFWIWQLTTSLFLHAVGKWEFLWFIFFMSVLWSIGRHMENRWGGGKFLLYYLLTGWVAALFVIAVTRGFQGSLILPEAPLLALFTAFAVAAPDALIYFFFPVTARQAVFLLILVNVLVAISGIGSRVVAAADLVAMAVGFGLTKTGLLSPAWDPRDLLAFFKRLVPRRKMRTPRSRFHDLDQEVDRILEKISKKGVNSLTPEEEEIMRRYSRMKK